MTYKTQTMVRGDVARTHVRAATWLLLGFGLFLAYTTFGMLPIEPLEGDGLGIANGAHQLATVGLDNTTLAYRYPVQSGTYAVVALLHQIAGVNTYVLLALISAFAALLLVLASAALLHRITGFPVGACGLVLLLFQEAYTTGYYGNSTVVAGFLVIAALWNAAPARGLPRLLLSGLLLGLGIWMRFDAVLVAPALLLLVHRGNWRQTITRTALVAGVTVVVALAALTLSGSSLQNILNSVGGHRELVSGSGGSLMLLENNDLRSHVTFFTGLVLLLIGLGCFHLLRTRQWQTLGTICLGTLPLYAAYTGAITTPKYLVYLLPFFACLALYAAPELAALYARHRTLAGLLLAGLCLLFVMQYVVGWEFSSSARPNLRKPTPTLVRLFSMTTPLPRIERVTWAIGAGSSATTGDGRRLLSGVLFAPIFQHHLKQQDNAEIAKLRRYLAGNGGDYRILTTEYYSYQLVLHLLLAQGYACQKQVDDRDYQTFVCRRGPDEARVVGRQVAGLGTPLAEMEAGAVGQIIDAMLARMDASTDETDILFVSSVPQEQEVFLSRAHTARRIGRYAVAVDLAYPMN